MTLISSPPSHTHSATPLIVVSGLSKSYREGDTRRSVLNNLDLTVNNGEIIALLGHSGGGKSTLLNLLSGIDHADSGQVVIDGIDVAALTEPHRTHWRRRQVGVIYQFFNLIPTLTVVENLLLPLELNRQLSAARRDQALQLLNLVGLGDRRASFPERLSGGEQQRVAIIRALIHQPSLLLADEPTGNLDTKTGREVMQLLLQMIRRHGTTALLATHSDAVAAQADRVIELHDGKLRVST